MKKSYRIAVNVAGNLVDLGIHLDTIRDRIQRAYPEAEVVVGTSLYHDRTVIAVSGYPYPGDAERRVLEGAQRIARNMSPRGSRVTGHLCPGFN